VARILALGHGAQILLSHATHDLVIDDLPEQVRLRDLGTYQLKDLSRPERLFQIVTPDIRADFPPLRAATSPSIASAREPAPLLDSKLHIPSPRSQAVLRPHLLARVQAGLQGKLTLIAAPAGYGKTTLISAWAASLAGSSIQLAWVSLDAEDNDPTRFWKYVLAALEMIYPTIGMRVGSLLLSPQPPPLDAVVTNLINVIAPLPIDAVLVLDDYHLITTPAIHAATAYLLDHLPAQLHLIMTTRTDPPLSLTRLRTRGELTELRAADLRFSAADKEIRR
jgi:LuxR family maltose regulon positive regulatory protein